MTMELIAGIRSAEEAAEKTRQDAQREAREIVKAAREAGAADERAAAREIRAQSQQYLEQRRREAAERIARSDSEGAKARGAFRAKAEKNIDAAAKMIFERIVSDGHR